MRYLFLVLIFSCFMGCASDVANRLYSSHPAKPVSQVTILKSAPTRAYEVIADFQSRGEDAESIRKKAAKIGADAVIVTYLGGYYDLGTEWAGKDPHSNTYSRIVGTAIIYK